MVSMRLRSAASLELRNTPPTVLRAITGRRSIGLLGRGVSDRVRLTIDDDDFDSILDTLAGIAQRSR